jgi:hypothetical protein
MDFDSIIVFLFIFAFFVLPSILKQVRARKKKTGVSPKKRGTGSLFGKIGDQIRQFIQEIEEQAQQQKKTGMDPGIVQETFPEEEPVLSDFEMTGEDANFGDSPSIDVQEMVEPEKIGATAKTISLQAKQPCMKKQRDNLPGTCRFKNNPLQNAIVWSEVLSKPVALRKE